jgi:hypothetical protein
MMNVMYLKKKIDETRNCSHNFSCLWDDKSKKDKCCVIESAAGENGLFLKKNAPRACPYKLPWGFGAICRCPTNYALFSYPPFNKVHVGALISDEDDAIVNAKNGRALIFGIPAESLVGTSIRTVFPEDTIRILMPHYEEAKKTSECQRYENIPVITPAGVQRYHSGWLIPRVIEHKVCGMVCTVEDVPAAQYAEASMPKAP